MKNLNPIWTRKRKSKVKKKLRIKLYKSMVKTVLTYNSGTWGLTKTEESSLNAFHRRQLRQVLGVKYPAKMRNSIVYIHTSEKPLSIQIMQSRWRLLGHCLRLHNDTPAKRAMEFFFEPSQEKGFRGRRRTTLPVAISKDLEQASKEATIVAKYKLPDRLENIKHLHTLHTLALDKTTWQQMTHDICKSAEAEFNKSL
jgi:hypothetical protein